MHRPTITILLTLLLACGTVQAESVQLIREHGIFVVPVVVNDKITLNFTIDSGASDVSIPADVFSTLTRAGTVFSNDFLDTQVYELADGSRHSAQRFRIRSLKLGNLELQDVTAVVVPGTASLLLGQSFLSRLPAWSIDNRRGLLVISSAKTPTANAGDDASEFNENLYNPIATLKENAKGTQVEIDTRTIEIYSTIRRATFLYEYPDETEKGTGDDAGRWKFIQWDNEAFNCANATYRVEQRQTRFTDDKLTKVAEASLSKDWKPVAPHTLIDAGMKFLCAWAEARRARWSAVMTSDDYEDTMFIDANSISERGGIRYAWDKLVNAYHTQKGFGEHSATWVNYSLAYEAFNCGEKKHRSEATSFYYVDGTNEGLREVLRSSWEPPPPGTLIAAELEFVCKWKTM